MQINKIFLIDFGFRLAAGYMPPAFQTICKGWMAKISFAPAQWRSKLCGTETVYRLVFIYT